MSGGRGRKGSGCRELLLEGGLQRSSKFLLQLSLVQQPHPSVSTILQSPYFCNCTICNEAYMEEKVGGSQVYNTEAACIFIGLRQIIKLSFDISTNIQKNW